jgi:hypothetical protein
MIICTDSALSVPAGGGKLEGLRVRDDTWGEKFSSEQD